jgi:hypothetical protein
VLVSKAVEFEERILCLRYGKVPDGVIHARLEHLLFHSKRTKFSAALETIETTEALIVACRQVIIHLSTCLSCS